MKCICIAGASQPDLTSVSDILQQAGMMPPKPGNRADFIDVNSWHEQALTLSIEEAIATPGRFMEQLAGDIFSANIKSSLWGWADTRSTWLLDFWLDFDPRLYFVLVYVSPEQMLANAIHSEAEIDSVSGVMEAWQAHYQHLLRFHLRNPERSLLVDASECVEDPHALIKRCAEQWKLHIDAPAMTDFLSVAHDSLALYLAQQLCQNYPQTASLQHELAATLTRFGETEQAASSTQLSAEHIIADYCTLRDKSAELELLRTAREELTALKSHVDATAASHAQQQEEAEIRLKYATQQNDTLKSKLATLTQEKTALAEQRSALDQEVAALSQARDQLSQQHEKTVAGHLQQQKDAEQENELLLLQLHQVQEELEHYFLQHQDKQKELQNAETRWQRMLQRNPDYCDYESIEIVPDNADGNTTHWRLKNLNAAGRSLPDIAFTTIVEQGIAGLVFPDQSAAADLLTRWPVNAANQNELTIIPIGSADLQQQRIETLLDLAIGDWDLVHALTRLLERTLEQPAADTLPAEFNAQPLRSGLAKLREVIENFPAILRYDRVFLKKEQVNPDYEHLWLRFDNLAFGNKRCQNFEFRLSCANVRPEHFGKYPKLEFPEESSQAPFEAWFIEAYDDFGAKLELRFALPESMDIEVLQRLAESDRDFLFALLARLPAILATLQNAGIQLKRSWEDWINMAKEIQHIYRLRTATQPAPTEVPLPALIEPTLVKTAVAKPVQRRTTPTTRSRKK